MDFMAGDSERPAMCERRTHSPIQISRTGMVHFNAVLTRQTFADMVAGFTGAWPKIGTTESWEHATDLLLHVAHTSVDSLGRGRSLRAKITKRDSIQ